MPIKHDAIDKANMSWEDPHPGERLSIPLGMSAGLHIYPQTISGDAMGGVAVKARGAYQDHGPCLIRRNSRGRHRNTMTKPLKIPAKVLEEPEMKGISLVPSQQFHLNPISPLHILPLPEPLQPLDFETDTDTEVGVETGTLTSDADTDQFNMTSISQTHPSDFSNYLGILQGEDDDDNASVTVVDSDGFTRANSDDAYGWEAELDRKINYKIGGADSMCPCRYQYQKADGGKRGLLQRVFSTSGRRVNSGF